MLEWARPNIPEKANLKPHRKSNVVVAKFGVPNDIVLFGRVQHAFGTTKTKIEGALECDTSLRVHRKPIFKSSPSNGFPVRVVLCPRMNSNSDIGPILARR